MKTCSAGRRCNGWGLRSNRRALQMYKNLQNGRTGVTNLVDVSLRIDQSQLKCSGGDAIGEFTGSPISATLIGRHGALAIRWQFARD